MKRILFISSALTLILFSTGCSTMKPLTSTERSSIRTIYVENVLNSHLDYVKIGTTVFQNKEEQIKDKGLFNDLYKELKFQITHRGYKLAPDRHHADCILRVEGLDGDYYLVDGAGFYVQSTFGLTPGIQAIGGIRFELSKCYESRPRVVKTISKSKLTGIKRIPASWDYFNRYEQDQMYSTLKSIMSSVPEEGMNKLGL